jgi:hypothetical protein
VLVKELSGATMNRVSDASSGIYIEHVHDVGSNTDDSALTPGNVLKIYGSKIKIAGDAPAAGA